MTDLDLLQKRLRAARAALEIAKTGWTDEARAAALEARRRGTYRRTIYSTKKEAVDHAKAARAEGFEAKVYRTQGWVPGGAGGAYAGQLGSERGGYMANNFHVHVGTNIQPPSGGAL